MMNLSASLFIFEYLQYWAVMNPEIVGAGDHTPKFTLDGRTIEHAKCTSVYDGDTATFAFAINEDGSGRVHRHACRMLGYNAAEMKGKGVSEEEKALGKLAKKMLIDKIEGKIVKLVTGDAANPSNHDPYGRPLVTVWFEGRNINEEMIKEGYGIPYGGKGEKKWKAEQN